MADEAFALSPISARGAQPDEADYEAIREAFMETARGRWFLGEYARRNRNADTRMVLDQVDRIERKLEVLRQGAPDTGPTEILVAITDVIDQAEIAAAAAGGVPSDDRRASIREHAGILMEISWRWREIGADSRICDAIMTHAAAIAESCVQLAGSDTTAALATAFERIRTGVVAIAEVHGAVPPPAASPAANCAATAPPAEVTRDEAVANKRAPAPATLPLLDFR